MSLEIFSNKGFDEEKNLIKKNIHEKQKKIKYLY
jgi:hypothetical protein